VATPIPSPRSARPTRLGKGPKNQDSAPGASRLVVTRRKRTRPFLVIGGVLVLGGAVASVAAYSQLGGRIAVIELRHGVTVGQVIDLSDLRSVQVAADSDVPLIPVSAASTVVGHRAGVALPAGTLLSRADLATGSIPAPGQTMLSLEVKPGAYPTQLAPGQQVAVATVTPAGQSAVPVIVSGLPTATVLSATPASNNSGDMEVSLVTGSGAAGQIASIPADGAQLIVTSPGGA
jgi:hypothetical protein